MKIKIQSFLNFAICIAIALVLSCCANEKAPEGGKKDTTPPKAKKISPPNKSLHFVSKKIEITFNEYIKSTGFAQTLISPPLDKRPDFKIANKTLVIKFKSPLRDSTTYTINFADDIKDVNEGNILNNFTYVFSTGNFIDSQKISGKVSLAKDNSSADGVIVSLYPEDSVNAIKRSKPFYFAKTDKNGAFQINNIKAAAYRVFALKDENYNYIFDQPNELIAFSDSLVYLTDTAPKKVELYLFDDAGIKTRFLGSRNVSFGYVQFYFSSPVKDFHVETDPSSERVLWYPNATKDTVNYWYSDFYDKKAAFYLSVNDSIKDTTKITLNNITIDSLAHNPRLRLNVLNQAVNQTDTSKARKTDKENNNIQELYKPLKIFFTRPIVEINEAKQLKLYEDSVKKDLPFKFSIDDTTKLFISLDFPKNESTSYTLEIPDSAYKDILGTWNRKIIYKFKTTSKDAYGNIHITFKNAHPEKDYLVKLMDANGAIVYQTSFTGEKEKKVNLENLPAGDYKVSVVDDSNHNGRWDTGNFKNRIQPEKVISFKDTHTLKGAWDLDIEINL